MLLYENAHRLVEMNAYKNFSLSLEGLKLTHENDVRFILLCDTKFNSNCW